MDTNDFIEISREALLVLLAVSTPILLVSLITGLLIAFFQALTQIQESTLTFVPKIIVVYLSMLVFAPYMTRKLKVFAEHVADKIIAGS